MDHEVFISYSHADKAVAEAVCAKLESHAIPCWMAPRNVLPGEPWGRSILGAIQRSRVMVVVLSARSNASPQVVREVERAVNHDLVVIPLRIEPVQPAEDLEYFLSSTHWLDALTPDLDKHLQTLYEITTVQLRRARAAAEEESPAPAARQTVETAPPPEPETTGSGASNAGPPAEREPSRVLEEPLAPVEPAHRAREAADLAPAEEAEESVEPRKARRSSSVAFILGSLGFLLCPVGIFLAIEGSVWGWLLCLIGPAAIFLGIQENSWILGGRSQASAGSARTGMVLGIFETGFMLLVGVIAWIVSSLKG